MIVFGLDLLSAVVIVTAVFGAGIIRGYSGFGFAMVTVTSMSLVLPPVKVVPAILILEVMASMRLVPQVWRQIDWHSLRWLLGGSILATHLGVHFLASIPAGSMRFIIGLLVLLAAIMLMRGFSLRRMPGKAAIFSTGVASGVLNGAAAIGGPPVILFYFSSPAGISVSRASIIAYFLGLDVIALITATAQGLTGTKALSIAALALIPLLLGITIGSRLFVKVNQDAFRHHVLILLIVLALMTLMRALIF